MSETAITALTSLSQLASSEASSQTSPRQEVSEGGNVSPQQSVLPQQSETEVSRDEVVEAVSNITDFVQNITRDLQFQIDDVTGGTVVTVLDRETSEVVRQIPSEEALKISRYIAEYSPDPVKGLLMNSES